MDKREEKGYRKNSWDRICRIAFRGLMNLKEKIKNYIRVLTIAKKPEKDDFLLTLRICLIGIGIIGTIGFFFYLISVLFLS